MKIEPERRLEVEGLTRTWLVTIVKFGPDAAMVVNVTITDKTHRRLTLGELGAQVPGRVR